jgi:ABC-type phosphate transport system auxiliary subunit
VEGRAASDPGLLREITQLIAEPQSGEQAPSLARIEHTLTAGYARALELEAERLRLERRIARVAAELADGPHDLRAAELASLAQRASSAGEDLAELRRMLASLKLRASELRAVA